MSYAPKQDDPQGPAGPLGMAFLIACLLLLGWIIYASLIAPQFDDGTFRHVGGIMEVELLRPAVGFDCDESKVRTTEGVFYVRGLPTCVVGDPVFLSGDRRRLSVGGAVYWVRN